MNRFEKLRLYISDIEGRIFAAKELARFLGVSPTLIGSIERGDIPPSPKVASILEKKYGISREWYLNERGVAPWEKEAQKDWFDFSEDLKKQVAEGKTTERQYKIHAGFGALCALLNTKEKELVDFFIEAAKNPEFRSYIYNVLRVGDVLLKKKEKPDYQFESTEVVLDFPTKPENLSKEESQRWDMNELTLRRWEKSQAAFNVPTEILEKFCRQAAGFYKGGSLEDIAGILKELMEGEK